jgi:hypothetical protein
MTIIIGEQGTGTSDDGTTGFLVANGPYALASAATIESLSLYLNGVTAGNIQLALYADSSGVPGALLAVTASTAGVATSWNTLNVVTPVLCSAANYWLALNESDGTHCKYRYKSQSSGCRYKSQVYGTYPDPCGTTTNANIRYSLYATFSEGGTQYTVTTGFNANATVSRTVSVAVPRNYSANATVSRAISTALSNALSAVDSVSVAIAVGVVRLLNGNATTAKTAAIAAMRSMNSSATVSRSTAVTEGRILNAQGQMISSQITAEVSTHQFTANATANKLVSVDATRRLNGNGTVSIVKSVSAARALTASASVMRSTAVGIARMFAAVGRVVSSARVPGAPIYVPPHRKAQAAPRKWKGQA